MHGFAGLFPEVSGFAERGCDGGVVVCLWLDRARLRRRARGVRLGWPLRRAPPAERVPEENDKDMDSKDMGTTASQALASTDYRFAAPFRASVTRRRLLQLGAAGVAVVAGVGTGISGVARSERARDAPVPGDVDRG
jgi:hypothetical protein